MQNQEEQTKKEAVEETIRELELEQETQVVLIDVKKSTSIIKFLLAISLPFRLPILGLIKLSQKIKLPITIKMMLLFTTIFAIIFIAFAVFLLASINHHLGETAGDTIYNLRIYSIVIIIIAVILFGALTGIIASLMLNPIRKITDDIDTITAEDLTKRLKPADSQVEFQNLTNRINWLLDDIETTFNRQDSFIADASHELKTPIAVVAGYSNMLKRWGSQREDILSEGIEAIHRESENMSRLVEKLLLLAKIGKMHTNLSKFDAIKVLEEVVNGYKLLDTKHDIRFTAPNEVIVFTDKSLLIELVRTLCDNAIRYTSTDGTITISCILTGDNAFKVSVADTGEGISELDQILIFDRFFRCDKARSKEKGGTGLGLTIAKSIADALGGTLQVQSELGNGSIFTFTMY
ncbi:MAG: HAMP domain-containing histidine kinase [Firmicutes bacterium]|nr:HAMP domain-containing histidine kinase [Bacillota bacterium]